MKRFRSIGALVGAAGIFFWGAPANAQCPTTSVACNNTGQLPNPVYLAGSSAFEPVASRLALQIKAKQGVSLIYSPISSCTGISSVYNDASLGLGTSPVALSGNADYYLPDPTNPGSAVYCSCALAGSTFADIGASDVAFESCQGTAKPATLGEWYGPEQAMLIVVPKANITTTAISAQQAGAIWGCGPAGNVSPFVDPNGVFKRSATSGTQIMVGRNIGSLDASGARRPVPESGFFGTSTGSSSEVFTRLVAYSNPQAAIGFIANDFYATHRSQLNAVAFRGFGQKKAYYADSNSAVDDLLNVREGRYMIQGPVHLFAKLQTDGNPVASTKVVLDWLTGATVIDPADPQFYVRTAATNGVVPQCAMKVKIDKDGGLFAPYSPPTSCDCAFRRSKSLLIAAGTCKACTADTDCSGGLRCQSGYCE